MNHLNETIGFSDEGCFDEPSEKYLHDCPSGTNLCSTEMEVDWTVLGYQTVNVKRSCATINSQAASCKEGNILQHSFYSIFNVEELQ